MEGKFHSPYIYNEDDPEFEYLVCLSGALVPIAHIKIIGQVEYGVSEMVDENDEKHPLWGFAVMLTDSNFEEDFRKNNEQMLYDSWDTQEEAEEQRRNLAVQVDNYYKRLLGDQKGGS